jgi:phosphotransferase system  glucose/maltose/N-acetylglucosamine-specific IIC component
MMFNVLFLLPAMFPIIQAIMKMIIVTKANIRGVVKLRHLIKSLRDRITIESCSIRSTSLLIVRITSLLTGR